MYNIYFYKKLRGINILYKNIYMHMYKLKYKYMYYDKYYFA